MLLDRLATPYDVVAPDIDERPLSGETPEATALRLAEAGDIGRDFATAGRVADVDGVAQVEVLGDGRGVGRVVRHVVTEIDLVGAAVAATVMGHDAVTVVYEEHHLRIPVVGG